MVSEIGAAEFKSAVIEADVPVLVDFYADWCGPCQAQGPVLELVASKLGTSALVKKVNVDRHPELADLFSASRERRSSTNDADRLRKYLARFDLDWASISDAG